MRFQPTEIPDVLLIEPDVYGDDRGYFLQTYHYRDYLKSGIAARFVQDNYSGSRQGTLRGLHYQIRQPQGKLVRVVIGEIFDVAVDLRRGSSTFGKHVATVLTAENKQQLWIPEGFAHGFYVQSEWAEFSYKTSNYYAPQWERTLLWSDPELGIKWPILDDLPLILAPKDTLGKKLDQAELYD